MHAFRSQCILRIYEPCLQLTQVKARAAEELSPATSLEAPSHVAGTFLEDGLPPVKVFSYAFQL